MDDIRVTGTVSFPQPESRGGAGPTRSQLGLITRPHYPIPSSPPQAWPHLGGPPNLLSFHDIKLHRLPISNAAQKLPGVVSLDSCLVCVLGWRGGQERQVSAARLGGRGALPGRLHPLRLCCPVAPFYLGERGWGPEDRARRGCQSLVNKVQFSTRGLRDPLWNYCGPGETCPTPLIPQGLQKGVGGEGVGETQEAGIEVAAWVEGSMLPYLIPTEHSFRRSSGSQTVACIRITCRARADKVAGPQPEAGSLPGPGLGPQALHVR